MENPKPRHLTDEEWESVSPFLKGVYYNRAQFPVMEEKLKTEDATGEYNPWTGIISIPPKPVKTQPGTLAHEIVHRLHRLYGTDVQDWHDQAYDVGTAINLGPGHPELGRKMQRLKTYIIQSQERERLRRDWRRKSLLEKIRELWKSGVDPKHHEDDYPRVPLPHEGTGWYK